METHMAIYASDLHGNRHAYERIFRIAKERDVRTVILGGDLTPKWPILAFGSGARVPFHPKSFRADENGDTYADFLTGLDPEMLHRSKLEKRYTWLGGYVQHTGMHLRWSDLLGQQQVLAKMLGVRGRVDRDTLPVLTEEEWGYLERALRGTSSWREGKVPEAETMLIQLRYAVSSSEDRQAATQYLRRCMDAGDVGKNPPAVVAALARRFQELTSSISGMAGISQEKEAASLVRIAALEHPLHVWAEKARSLHLAVQPQKTFIEQILTKWLKRFREELPDTRVFLILGNDDVEECQKPVENLEKKGLVTVLHSRAVELGDGLSIAGYPHVPPTEGFYPYWQKPEDEILEDLNRLESEAGDSSKTVFVVHCPPGYTTLDTAFGGNHYGSHAVREWLGKSRKRVVLSGHIHESPFMDGGSWREDIDGTPCYQPGGWHDEGLCGLLLDLNDPREASWIHESGTPIDTDT